MVRLLISSMGKGQRWYACQVFGIPGTRQQLNQFLKQVVPSIMLRSKRGNNTGSQRAKATQTQKKQKQKPLIRNLTLLSNTDCFSQLSTSSFFFFLVKLYVGFERLILMRHDSSVTYIFFFQMT